MQQHNDPINPNHYKDTDGIECIEITRELSFNVGNAVKYLWRAGKKDVEIQELQKALWYLNDELNTAGTTVLFSDTLYSGDKLERLEKSDLKYKEIIMLLAGGRNSLYKVKLENTINKLKEAIEMLQIDYDGNNDPRR